jgi:hypothetical protein
MAVTAEEAQNSKIAIRTRSKQLLGRRPYSQGAIFVLEESSNALDLATVGVTYLGAKKT